MEQDGIGKQLDNTFLHEEGQIPGFVSEDIDTIFSKPTQSSPKVSTVRDPNATKENHTIGSLSLPIPKKAAPVEIGQRLGSWMSGELPNVMQSSNKNEDTEEEEDLAVDRRRTIVLDKRGDRRKENADLITKNLRIMQKRAIYGTLEQGTANNSEGMTKEYRERLLRQLDRSCTELPEPLQVLLSRELLPVVDTMYKEYSHQLGPRKSITKLARRQLINMAHFTNYPVPKGVLK